MAMAIDSQQHREFGSGMPFNHSTYPNSPHFTDSWTSSSGPPPSHQLYAPTTALNPNLGLDTFAKQQGARINSNSASIPSYSGASMTATSASISLLGGTYGQDEMLTLSQDLLSPPRLESTNNAYGNEVSYTSAPAVTQSIYARSMPYETMGYVPAPIRSTFAVQQHQSLGSPRRLSQQGVITESTRSFGDALDASQGMIAMSQNTAPRNSYRPVAHTGRGSGDSYGFTSTHSPSSSISSRSNLPPYFGGSMDSSISDYSGTSSDMESISSRTLPRPSGLVSANIPPPPQSMMSQFSSKVSSGTQKKHKCKVCDKRFTRPSSLQTHIYSHTGEKPFSCEVEGCGRHFSVVSNLRRHLKVHKGDARSEAGSDHSDD